MPVNNWCRTIFKGCCWLREKSFERKKRFVNFSNIQPTWFLSCFKVPCLEGKESPFMFSSPTEDPPSEVDSENEERLFVTPQPSGAQLTTGRTHTTKRRRGRSYSQSTPTTKRRNTLFNYYATQQQQNESNNVI